ncbi:MAG: EI24 domain-containing protein [Deltaproteobacteria bacterium]|nr:EI24 domain-containing protein [Deltaproteobacteria bacterium]
MVRTSGEDLPVRDHSLWPVVPVASGSVVRRFVRGASYPWRGLRFLFPRTEIWPWAAGPFLITLWMILGALWGAVWYGDDLLALFWTRPALHSSGTFEIVVWDMVANWLRLLVFLVLAVASWILGNMLASPFYDVLAEKTEGLVLDRPEHPFDWRIAFGDAWMSIRHSALGLLLYLLVMGPLFLLNLIPGVGSVLYTALSTAATVFFVARELMDIPLSRRRTPFVAKLRWMARHKALLAGMGAVCTLLLMVPLVNFFAMPIAVMGGTLMYCHLDREGFGVPQRGPGFGS